MIILLLLICVFLIGLCYYFYRKSVEVHQHNLQIDKNNQQLEKLNLDLQHRQQSLNEIIQNKTLEYQQKQSEIHHLTNRIKDKNDELIRLHNQTLSAAETEQELLHKAFDNYVQVLEQEYQKCDENFNKKIQEQQEKIAAVQKDLDSISATRSAARAALQKEQEVKDNKDNYRLNLSTFDLDDVHRLELLKKEFHKPRVLSMLIWSSYFQPLAKTKFPQILQDKTKTGIYKITNTVTDMCYIGQARNTYQRWSDHCKCGLGIDTPSGNKLYKAMQEYGLENFTFELLEECSVDELDEKERYFISLYEADTFGYNSVAGITKK